MSVMLHVANLHKIEVVTASISAQILLVVPTLLQSFMPILWIRAAITYILVGRKHMVDG